MILLPHRFNYLNSYFKITKLILFETTQLLRTNNKNSTYSTGGRFLTSVSPVIYFSDSLGHRFDSGILHKITSTKPLFSKGFFFYRNLSDTVKYKK